MHSQQQSGAGRSQALPELDQLQVPEGTHVVTHPFPNKLVLVPEPLSFTILRTLVLSNNQPAFPILS